MPTQETLSRSLDEDIHAFRFMSEVHGHQINAHPEKADKLRNLRDLASGIANMMSDYKKELLNAD